MSATRCDCKYHIGFIPKFRKKVIYGALQRNLGELFHELARQKECKMVGIPCQKTF
ncbi:MULTISPECIES: transposase [unclassified Undibacterium]|uniref:transposase n=1 Tax=unclassified Undibacterium TaxID=2630295 RepID=UPI0034DD3CBB